MTIFIKFDEDRTKDVDFLLTRKYLLCGYILGVLKHTTAWDHHWEGDEILKLVLM